MNKDYKYSTDEIAMINGGKLTTISGKTVKGVRESLIKKAVDAGETYLYLEPRDGRWSRQVNIRTKTERGVIESILSGIAPETKVETPMEEKKELNPAEKAHEAVLSLIHNSFDKKPDMLMMSELKWKYLVRSVVRGNNIMMTGAAGSGKTFAAQCVGKAMEREFFYFNLGATQDPRATLIGNTHFKEGEGTFFNSSLFVKAIQTPNAIILLDELSRSHPEAANILMTVLDKGQRYLRLDEQENAPTVKVAEGVSFIATANIGTEYTATRVMDKALMDRFTVIEMDMLEVEQETALLKMLYPNLDEKYITAIAEVADGTRKELKTDNPRLSTSISTRNTVELASLMYDGFSLMESAEVAVLPFFDNDGGLDSERTYVVQLLQKYKFDEEEETENLFDVGDEDEFELED